MAIEYKIVERANPQNRAQKKYYASANITGETSTKELCKEIEESSTVSEVDVQAVLFALAKIIPRHLVDGKSVALTELGKFRLTVRSKGEATKDEVDVHSIESAHIIFTPTRDFAKITNDLHYKKIS